MAEGVRIALTADWHIAEGAWRNRGVCGDAKHSLSQVVDYAVANRLAAVIAAGDLYDTDDPDPGSVGFVEAQVSRLADAQIPLYYVVGQHERHRSGARWLGISRRTIPLDGSGLVSIAGLGVAGLDWTPASRLPARLAELPPGVQLLVMHQVCKELMDVNHEVVLADVPGDADIVVGDYHVSGVIVAGGHRVISPGSLAMQSIDESASKYFYIYDVESREVERVALATRPAVYYEVGTQDDLDRFLADRPWGAVPAGPTPELARPLVSVAFDVAIPMAAQRIAAAIGDDEAHLFLRPVDRARRRRQAGAAAATVDVPAILAGMLPEPRERELLSRLLATGRKGMAAELAAARDAFFDEHRRVADGLDVG